MNKIMKLGLIALVSLYSVSCVRNFKEDFYMKGTYENYSVSAFHNGEGYNLVLKDTTSTNTPVPTIHALSENFGNENSYPTQFNKITSTNVPLDNPLRHYMSADSLAKIYSVITKK